MIIKEIERIQKQHEEKFQKNMENIETKFSNRPNRQEEADFNRKKKKDDDYLSKIKLIKKNFF